MGDESIISVRINKNLHAQMKLHDEINWSAILRKALGDRIEQLESVNRERARKATKVIDKIRKSKVFDGGKSSTEIIREWREKRK